MFILRLLLISLLMLCNFSLLADDKRRYVSDGDSYELYQYVNTIGQSYWILRISGTVRKYENVEAITIGEKVTLSFSNEPSISLPQCTIHYVYIIPASAKISHLHNYM